MRVRNSTLYDGAKRVNGRKRHIDPTKYIGQGDRYNWSAFASQADAQAVLRADPRDPNRLDADRDGIACESNASPKDVVPVPRP